MLYILVLLLNSNPVPVFAFLETYYSMSDCITALREFEKTAQAEIKNNAGCMVVRKPSNKEVSF